jgi:NAD(P)-dependent dehydrogenase (short-subunit alcohol dehydrogenase family)
LELNPLKVVGLECDVSSEVSVAKAFTRTLEVFGRVDAVVASAGMFYLSPEPPANPLPNMNRDH